MPSSGDLLDQLQRQLDEIEALRAMFPEWDDSLGRLAAGPCGGAAPASADGTSSSSAAGLLLEPMERQALSLAQQVCDATASMRGPSAQAEDDPLDGLPLLSGTVRQPGVEYGGQPVALRFTLPRAYPGGSQAGAGGQGPGGGPERGALVAGGGASGGAASGRSCGGAATSGNGGSGGEEEPAYRYSWRAAMLAVECAGPRHVHERLSGVVRRVAEAQAAEGCECLLLALDALKDAVEELTAAPDGADGAAGGPAVAGDDRQGPGIDTAAPASEPEGLLCCLVWLHHLKSLTKRKLIVQWARELRLAGACKPGFPGVIVVEGHSGDVQEFLDRMRSLSWQAMQVRGQDLLPLPAAGGGGGAASCIQDAAPITRLDAARRLRSSLPFSELEEGGMSELGALCRAAGLHHVFMTALKL